MGLIKSETITKSLSAGDKVRTIAVSSPINDEDCLLEGIKVFEEWGLICQNEVSIGKHWGYLAEKDPVRYKQLHSSNDSDLIAFAKGGWGAARLLENHQPWRKGWMVGYSDLSSLLLARLAAGYDGAIHGPLVSSISKEPAWSKDRLRSLLFEKSVPDLSGTSWNNGIATGPLVAANLTVASNLLGSNHIPNLKGAILVLEDISEEPYRIDRMLTQWRLNGILQNLAGLAFGSFLNCKDQEEKTSQKFSINEVLKERSSDLNIPVIADLPVGHCCGNAALPLGWEATIDGDKGILSLRSP